MDAYTLDDAAVAALYALAPKPTEHIGVLYRAGDSIVPTTPINKGYRENSQGKFSIPAGSALGLFHNHPALSAGKRAMVEDNSSRLFSATDRQQAKDLGLPSYITTPEGLVRKYDPITGTTSDVLGLFPLEEIKKMFIDSFGINNINKPPINNVDK